MIKSEYQPAVPVFHAQKGYKKEEHLVMLGCTDETNQRDDEEKDAACDQTSHKCKTCYHGNRSAIGCYTNQDEGHHLKPSIIFYY